MKKSLTGLLLLTIIALSGCSFLQYPNPNSREPTHIALQRNVQPFDTLIIRGPLNVQLDSRQHPVYFVRLEGNPRAVKDVEIYTKGKTLFVEAPQNYVQQPPMALAYICLNGLKYLSYTGNGYVMGTVYGKHLKMDISGNARVNLAGSNIGLRTLHMNHSGTINISGINNTKALDIIATGPGNIYLTGNNIKLRRLYHSGSGQIRIYWINSPDVMVRNSNRSRIFLAGVAGLLDVESSGGASLDAKYLRTRKAFINTRGNSRAEVFVSESLNAFATGNSNIYYYRQPLLIGKYTRDRGTILYMGETPPPCTEPFCPPLPAEPG